MTNKRDQDQSKAAKQTEPVRQDGYISDEDAAKPVGPALAGNAVGGTDAEGNMTVRSGDELEAETGRA